MPETCELHFQEGFSGETVEVRLDTKQIAVFTIKTRMQIGLAHVEKITASEGDRVEILIKESGLSKTVSAIDNGNYIIINLKNGKLEVSVSRVSPGYL